jgi:hypothetical protein
LNRPGYEARGCASRRKTNTLDFLWTGPFGAMSNYTNEKVVGIPQVMNGIVLSPEEEELAKLGYKQEFTRDYSWFSTFSFAFSISGLLATMTVMPKLPGLIHI